MAAEPGEDQIEIPEEAMPAVLAYEGATLRLAGEGRHRAAEESVLEEGGTQGAHPEQWGHPEQGGHPEPLEGRLGVASAEVAASQAANLSEHHSSSLINYFESNPTSRECLLPVPSAGEATSS